MSLISKDNSVWNFEEEKQPCGTTDFKVVYRKAYGRTSPMPHITVKQVDSHPWFLILWQKFEIETPEPPKCQPYCCYLYDVFFYERPYRVTEDGKSFFAYGTQQHYFTHDDVIRFNGDDFVIRSAGCVRYNGSWYMRYLARIKQGQLYTYST